MSLLSSRRQWLGAVIASALVAACGGSQPEAATPQPGQPAQPSRPAAPRNADKIAREVVNAKLGTLIHMDRVRPHPLAPQLANMDPWGPLFQATGIDPLKDVERAFVASANVTSRSAAIVVVEHSLNEARLQKAIQTMVAKSGPDGAILSEYGVPAARIMVKKRTSVVLAVSPNVLAITSERYATAAMKLRGTGGLPGPRGAEAVWADAIEPATSLAARQVPPIPATISKGWASVVLVPGGDADLRLEGISSSPEQASLDADELTETVDQATMVKIAIVRVRVADPIPFHAEGERVKGKRRVTLGELQMLMGMLSSRM